eukprot:SAG22_NODE_655_length_8104_cov_6.498438_5_plen_45_part_00
MKMITADVGDRPERFVRAAGLPNVDAARPVHRDATGHEAGLPEQ